MSADRKYIEAVGRRKTAVARVRLYDGGTGQFLVNSQPLDTYFPAVSLQAPVRSPFAATGTVQRFDVSVHVRGGGIHSQADAVRLGIARALQKADETLRMPLRAASLLTRDPREKERKKPGLKRARRAPQWQKR